MSPDQSPWRQPRIWIRISISALCSNGSILPRRIRAAVKPLALDNRRAGTLRPRTVQHCDRSSDGPWRIHGGSRSDDLAFQVNADVPLALVGDSVRLRQVLVNLAANAIKFTKKGEVVVDAALESRQGRELTVHFTLRNNGIGIPIDKQSRLFQPFEQADSSTTRQYGGTGLGLAISKKILDLLGGQIWMESSPGEGSTFHFTARLAPAEKFDDISLPSTADLRGMPVLIIDDNATNRRILSEMAGRWQMVPQTADSGGRAGHAGNRFGIRTTIPPDPSG